MNNEQRSRAIAADIYWDRTQAALSQAKDNRTDSELLERLDATAHQNANECQALLAEEETQNGGNTETSELLAKYRDEAAEAASETSWIYEQSYEA